MSIPSNLPEEKWPVAERPSPEHIYTFRYCREASNASTSGWSWYLPTDTGPSLETLVRQAFGALRTPAFSVAFNPPGRALVNFPTWFWAQGAGAGEITGSSALGVVAIGAPARMEVDPGDGSGVQDCAWSVAQSDACSWTYLRSSARETGRVGDTPAYAARARLVYDVRFTNNGAPLVAAGLPTTLESPWQSVLIPVAEIQSVVTTNP